MGCVEERATTEIYSFFFKDAATTEIYTLSLRDALPISRIRVADVTIEILYIEASISLANDLFPELEVRADIASDGNVISLEIALPEDCSGCPAFFELIKGALEVAPLLLDQDPVEVAMEVHPEFARYAVEIPRGLGQLIPLDQIGRASCRERV